MGLNRKHAKGTTHMRVEPWQPVELRELFPNANNDADRLRALMDSHPLVRTAQGMKGIVRGMEKTFRKKPAGWQ